MNPVHDAQPFQWLRYGSAFPCASPRRVRGVPARTAWDDGLAYRRTCPWLHWVEAQEIGV